MNTKNAVDLIPKELQKQIPKLYETENVTDPIAYVKLFLPESNWTWYLTEVSIDEDICFGYVVSPYGSELGYFSLDEIKELRTSLGLGVERDLNFTATKLSVIKKDAS